METRKRRIVLGGLVVGHVVAGVVFARWVYIDLDAPPPPRSRIVDAVLHAIILAQMGLLGCWAALGTSRLAWRLTASTAGAVLLSFLDRITAITLVNSGWRGLIPPLAVFGVLFGLRTNRVLQVDTPTKSTRWHFSIQDVLILSTAVIALTVVSRWWRVPHLPFGYFLIVSAHVAGITLTMIWAVLRPGSKAVVISLASILMVVALEQYPNRAAFWYVVTHIGELRWQDVFRLGLFWLFSTVLESLIILATILICRSCGYLTVRLCDNDQPIRLRFSLRQLFLVVTLVGVGLGTWQWLFRKVALVQAATTEDHFADDDVFSSRRNVAVVTGSFTRDTSLSISLHTVQAGKAVQRPAVVFGREDSWNTKGPFRKDVRLWLSLVETIRATDLLMSWTENGESDERRTLSTKVNLKINIVAKETLPGTITSGRPRIVYVEGDQEIVVDGSMTVEDFAKANPGNYLVVTVEVK